MRRRQDAKAAICEGGKSGHCVGCGQAVVKTLPTVGLLSLRQNTGFFLIPLLSAGYNDLRTVSWDIKSRSRAANE
jgi:hypothetical protein